MVLRIEVSQYETISDYYTVEIKRDNKPTQVRIRSGSIVSPQSLDTLVVKTDCGTSDVLSENLMDLQGQRDLVLARPELLTAEHLRPHVVDVQGVE